MKIKSQVPKNRNTLAKTSHLSSLNESLVLINKQLSQHTKMSTNATNSSLHINSTSLKNIKTKKSKSKEKLISNSKNNNSKRLQLDQLKRADHSETTTIRNKNKNHIKQSSHTGFDIKRQFNCPEEGNISYRQYCLVDKAFVPIKTSKEMKQLQDIMRSTANTFNCENEFQQQSKEMYRTTAKLFPFKKKQTQSDLNNFYLIQNSFQLQQGKEKRSRQPSESQSFQLQNNNILKQLNNIQFKEKQIICQDVSVQYSSRFDQPQKKQQVKVIKEIDIQTEQSIQHSDIAQKKFKRFATLVQTETMIMAQNSENNESLSDLLLKLQFKHLPNQSAFDNLTINQKQHYVDLLTTLAAKLKSACSPRKKASAAVHQSAFKIEQVNFNPLQNITKKYEKLQMETYKRECIQMGFIQNNLDFDNQEVIDTSMIGISTFLFNFTCYLELHYASQFLLMIKRQYGPMFKQKYNKVIYNNVGEKPRRQIKVLDEGLFQQFCQQTMEEINQYQVIHLKAIFDMINELLDTYRPYFKHKGQPFPWAVKMFSNICQYAFDQNSMEVIMCQIKQNIGMSVSNLAGIIIDDNLHQDITQMNPLILKRKQRQDMLVRNWLSQETNENKHIQCNATRIMAQLAKQIENMLFQQLQKELCF